MRINSICKKAGIIYAVFCVAIHLIGGFLFFYNYEYANNRADIIPNRFVLVYVAFIFSVIMLVCAFIIKCVFKHEVKLPMLILIAVLVPSFTFVNNYRLFGNDAPLSFVAKSGGPLHFIAEHDFNLDGKNDEEHRLETQKRTVGSGSSIIDSYAILTVFGEFTGVGTRLDHAYVGINLNGTEAYLHYNETVALERVDISLTFIDEELAKDTRVYLRDTVEKVYPEQTRVGDTISFSLNEEQIKNHRKPAVVDSYEIIFYLNFPKWYRGPTK